MSEEIQWKPVVGFEGIYEVSNRGDIRSMPRFMRPSMRPIRHAPNAKGYPQFVACRFGLPDKSLRVHRCVADAFLPPVSGKTHVNHINGNKADNRVENLEWCTNSENVRHGYATSNRPSWSAKLTREVIAQVKARYAAGGVTQKQLGDELGVHDSTISTALRDKTFRRLQAS